jgi:hypothetical protein
VVQKVISPGNPAEHLANAIRRLVNGHDADSNHRVHGGHGGKPEVSSVHNK